jgi:hypothetical protein
VSIEWQKCEDRPDNGYNQHQAYWTPKHIGRVWFNLIEKKWMWRVDGVNPQYACADSEQDAKEQCLAALVSLRMNHGA